MKRKWTEEEIWAWYKEHEWISGFNFVPSTSLGGMLYVLQEYDHENVFQLVKKEIELAASLGLNSVRVLLPFYLWRKQHDTFFKNLDEFIELLDANGMTMMPILFNDCTVPRSQYKEPVLGPQPEPVPGFLTEPMRTLLTLKPRQEEISDTMRSTIRKWYRLQNSM